MDSWTEHVIWWHVYPLGFVGAEPTADAGTPVTHRLDRLHGWLDHVISLGANGLALGPIFASETHGYDTRDYLTLDPRLGDDDDFDALISACRERGIRVLLDGVFNHAGRSFPPVAEAIAAGPGGPAGQWIRWSGEHPYAFEGHEPLVTLDHGNPAVQDMVVEVMNHWLDRGIDGWRLDAAYAVPAEFWAAVLPRVRERHPDAWFVGEMIHGPYDEYVAASTLDSITQYELWKATWSSLRERNLWELDWTVRRNDELLSAFVPMTFVSNHDVTRVAGQIEDHRHRSHAAALLLFLPGVPSIYYGDEFGFDAVKEDRPGGDDAVRPEMPSTPAEVADDDGLRSVYERLIGVRRRHPWLLRAHVEMQDLADERARLRATSADGQSLVLALNLAEEPYPVGDLGEVVETLSPLDGEALPPHSWSIHAG
ncbi:DUF3459 domain-containing protein [Nakamurella flava]|uniref:DUF3459 domain-containing protein n=1 Tax=Nakamurella flava TaxID=2576308 RepID=A0A4U6QAJ1_9ACTN|nr:alpha-amylase family glycosyl hydrolase [Nakamurella flava]TKV56912.1 DUF3459 domain-containing protein [Nakamurella flava]